MKVSALDHRNAKEVAELMHRIKPDWWPSAADAYGQLTDLSETIGTIGWGQRQACWLDALPGIEGLPHPGAGVLRV